MESLFGVRFVLLHHTEAPLHLTLSADYLFKGNDSEGINPHHFN